MDGFSGHTDSYGETFEDSVCINIGLSANRFDALADMIRRQELDTVELYLTDVSGFYSRWTIDIGAVLDICYGGQIKILLDEKVTQADDCEIKPKCLGLVRDYSLHFVRRAKLNLKQDYTITDPRKLFYSEFYPELYPDCLNEEEVEEEVEEETNTFFDVPDAEQEARLAIIRELSATRMTAARLSLPLWIAAVMLVMLVILDFKLW